jgi:two-component system osmolarity sensor histidine kinase EnvZ
MRNGLGTILTQARLVEAADASPADVTAAARAIREECETLEAVIRRFVDFVREERLECAEFDLARLLRRVVAREGRSHPDCQVSLEAPEATRIVADEDLLERGLENLVRNALEAAGSGGRVDVSVLSGSRGVEIRIADDGPGLPAGAEALRPFTSGKAGGLGLGLPLALKIVQLHGGELDLAPRHPRGLDVRVRLPVAPRATEGSTKAIAAAQARNAVNDGTQSK